MNSKFSVNDLIYRANKRRSDNGESNQAQDYGEILDKLQRLIAKHHSAELAEVLYSKEAEGTLKDLIMRYLNQEQLVAKDPRNISELVDAVYYDMAGMGLLSPYLQDADTEEINIDGSGGVWVLYRDKKIRLKETFSNAEACANIVRKDERVSEMSFWTSKPLGSFLPKHPYVGSHYPLRDPECRGYRVNPKQKALLITRENLIEWEPQPRITDLLTFVSSRLSSNRGATGSGKTADMGYVRKLCP